jgi:hypothetical protein
MNTPTSAAREAIASGAIVPGWITAGSMMAAI